MNDEQVIELAWEEYEELLHLIAPHQSIKDVKGINVYESQGRFEYQYKHIGGEIVETPHHTIEVSSCVDVWVGEQYWDLDFSNRSRVCSRCGTKVEVSPIEVTEDGGYPWYCPHHDEDLYSFETEVLDKEDSLW